MVNKFIDALRGFTTGISGGTNPIVDQAKELETLYSQRQKNFSSWYNLLSMKDELAQTGMESSVGNDPRTLWNMANFLLQPKPFTHKVVNDDGSPLIPPQREIATFIENHFINIWKSIDAQDAKRGKQSWFWNMIGYMLVTGWYALPNLVEPDGKLTVDYWNPAQVFPEFDEEGLVRLARVRSLANRQARRVAEKEGWDAPSSNRNLTEYQMWWNVNGVVLHGVSFDNQIVKPVQETGLIEIPIEVGSLGGIPNTQSKADSYYSFTEGQSILATNEKIYANMNRQATFMQQLLRDTANPRVFQRIGGERKIINDPQEWYARGAFFSGGINDSLEVIPMPAIPVEITQLLFSLRNQAQRGGFSDLAFGNVLQEVSSIILSQAADSARQLLFPFHMGLQYIVSRITTNWYKTMLSNPGIRPSNWPDIPPELMSGTSIVSTYHISIPGDLSNRILMVKQLNPDLRLPSKDLMELLLPEIPNVSDAMGRLESEDAKKHPSYVMIKIINSFEQASAEADRQGNSEYSKLFRLAAGNLKRQLTGELSLEDRVSTGGNQAGQDVIPSQSAQIRNRLRTG